MPDQPVTITRPKTAAVRHLEQAIASGKHWFIALLEAIRLWTEDEESYNGRHYRYVINGEALDWLLLAERLSESVASLVPEEERLALVFQGRVPLRLTREQFKGLIGPAKYRQYLNYFYGVTVEEALVKAVQDEVRKERYARGRYDDDNLVNEVYLQVYGATRAALLKRFRREKGYPQLRSISLAELKEFTYWLFKYRLAHSEKARAASDTKKALAKLLASGFPDFS